MKFSLSFLLICLFSGLLLPSLAFSADPSASHSAQDGHALETTPLKLSLGDDSSTSFKYVCPMHSQIIRDHEGTCPICGMELVKQAIQQSMGSPTISVGGGDGAKGLKQGLAIRTIAVQRNTIWKYIPTFGKVVADETKVIHLHPRASGWISHLTVRSVGDAVKKGQLLYRFYSPEIVSAQQDLILALQSRKRLGQSGTSLVDSAKVRLQLLGISDRVIKRVVRQKKAINEVPIYASQSGVVSLFAVQDGMYIEPKIRLMSISDLSSVWVEAEVLPLQQSWVQTGLTANLTSQAFPGERWESQIEYLYPLTDARTQALKVRLPVENPQLALKPNMFMDIEIYGGAKRNVLAIPLEAVIDDGVTQRVVRQLEGGQFEVVEVAMGIESQGVVEILSGLKEGQRIVLSGQFLIDSESQIQANLRRLVSTGSQAPMPNMSHTSH
ncbi:MAG: membrane fusion protein, copper/silver efflux system [Thiomicrorhabdus sp.]|nr:MAG: membrane fusion protein, copper/silver efflux system [Thiomicrorhabdus sp.]